jgi:hypothetical protein
VLVVAGGEHEPVVDGDAGDHRICAADRLAEPFEVAVDATADESLLSPERDDLE